MKYLELVDSLKIMSKIYSDYKITYSVLLLADEWEEKREEILIRDNYCCRNCGVEWNPKTIQTKEVENVSFYKIRNYWEEELVYKNWKKEVKNKPNSILQVHHKYYQINKLPWEYNNEALVSLCSECHQKEHEENFIHVYDENMERIKNFNVCERCNGSGYLHEFSHVHNGICFECKGNRYTKMIFQKSF